jgi:Protein of unknown function (DUF3237)
MSARRAGLIADSSRAATIARVELEYELTYEETIDGPLGPTSGSPNGERVCWQIESATLRGPRIQADLAMPGADWMRLGADGIRRQDLRAQFVTQDGKLILFRYDLALLRPSERFLAALAAGEATEFEDQYMRIAPHFEASAGKYAWLNESLFLGQGRLTGPRAISYEVYRVL